MTAMAGMDANTKSYTGTILIRKVPAGKYWIENPVRRRGASNISRRRDILLGS